MLARSVSFSLVAILFTLVPGTIRGENWPAWRGTEGNGVATNETAPVTWSTTENVAWKTPLAAGGNSTPIIWEDQIFLTEPDATGHKRCLTCYDRKTGKQQWQHAEEISKKIQTHKTNPHCSSSAATDGEHVVAWLGSAGLYCFNLEGKKQWSFDVGEIEHIWGWAASPVIYKDLVILNVGPGTNSFLVAVNKHTGKEVWRREIENMTSENAKEFRGSWSTPVIAPATDGKGDVMLLTLPLALRAMNPQTGEDIWTCEGITKLIYTSPMVTNDMVIAMSGYGGASMGVKRGGKGNALENRVWLNDEKRQNPQRIGSGVVIGEHLYINNAPGVCWCIEIKTGKTTWEQRLGGDSWSNMVLIDGRLYVVNMAGVTHVIDPDPTECKVLAENDLSSTTRGSIAVSNGQLFIRTYDHLWCIGESK